jgi:hypothetical protein
MSMLTKKLPHKYPVRFIKEVQVECEEYAESLVAFKEVPTLPAVVEAAAQNIIFIHSMYRDFEGGVLTGMKNVELFKSLEVGEYNVKSTIVARLDNFCTLKFELLDKNIIVANGEMNIVMKERK